MADPEQAVETTPKIPEKPKSKAGRHTKLTPELIAQVKLGFIAGLKARRVCDALLIGESTWYRWVIRGKADEAAGRWKSLFWQFWETIKQGQAEFDLTHLTKIADVPDWRAHAWLLERQFEPEPVVA